VMILTVRSELSLTVVVQWFWSIFLVIRLPEFF
jgi:hypothetical protein